MPRSARPAAAGPSADAASTSALPAPGAAATIPPRPAIFQAESVRGIFAGTKTQTRRIVRDQKAFRDGTQGPEWWSGFMGWESVDVTKPPLKSLRCPYGRPGERIWARETWAAPFARKDGTTGAAAGAIYRADYGHRLDLPREYTPPGGWRSPIHMPRWASRLTLEITDVRVERLQEITEEDARAEGATLRIPAHLARHTSYRYEFKFAWINMHGPGAWKANPWVWAISFRRVDA